MATIPSSTGQAGLSWSPDNLVLAYVGTAGFARSGVMTQTTTTFTVSTTPVVFKGVKHCGAVIFANNDTGVYLTINNGSSWELIYSGTPHTITASDTGSILYILNVNGDLVVMRYPERSSIASNINSISTIGSTLESFKSSVVPFVSSRTTINGAILNNVPPGVWAVCAGWVFGSVGINGDGDFYVTYGLSYSSTGFEILRKNKEYTMLSTDPTSFESYAECIIVTITETSTIYLNAYISRNTTQLWDATMNNSFIRATLVYSV